MEHQLLVNFEAWASERKEVLDARIIVWLRKINIQLIERHGDLFDSRHVVSSPNGTIQGHPYMVQTSRLHARIDLTEMEHVGTRYGPTEHIYLGQIADEIAAELRHEDDLDVEIAGKNDHPAHTRCQYIPVTSAGISWDVSSLDPVVTFLTMRARIQLSEPCPPCEIDGRNADLTKFGLPPIK